MKKIIKKWYHKHFQYIHLRYGLRLLVSREFLLRYMCTVMDRKGNTGDFLCHYHQRSVKYLFENINVKCIHTAI